MEKELGVELENRSVKGEIYLRFHHTYTSTSSPFYDTYLDTGRCSILLREGDKSGREAPGKIPPPLSSSGEYRFSDNIDLVVLLNLR